MTQPLHNTMLDNRSLKSLRGALDALAQPGAGVPLAALSRLGNQFPGHLGCTVDFGASRVLGVPVVVLRPPAGVPGPTLLARLSRREQDVAQLVLRGLRNKDIAARLGIQLGTVKDHVHHILRKTGVESRSALVAALAR